MTGIDFFIFVKWVLIIFISAWELTHNNDDFNTPYGKFSVF